MRALFTAMAYSALTDGSASDIRRAPRPSRGATRPTRRRGLTSRGRIAAAAIGGIVSLTLLAGTAHGKGSVYLPAPAYPNSKLAIDVAGKPRAGRVVKVVVSGSNAPFEIGYPGSGDYIAYQLDVFAQNGKVVPNCPRSFTEELQNSINLGVSRIAQGFPEGYYGGFQTPVRFQTSRSVRNIVVCAYSRLIDDDAAVSALGFKLRPPRCTCRKR
jgi:hypothetical protein